MDRSNTLFLLIDIQEKLLPVMHETQFVSAAAKLVNAAAVLEIPVICTEQLADKLGSTVADLSEHLADAAMPKSEFSAWANSEISKCIQAADKHSILIMGIEAHICVYQTASDLIKAGYEVHVAADAISSRDPLNKQLAIDRLRSEGVIISSSEMAIMELQKIAGGDSFRDIVRIIK